MVTLTRGIILLLAVALLLPGCVVPPHGPHGRVSIVASPAPQVKSGPPPHAKAYGHRAKYHYHYYPDAMVYFDTGREVYFHIDGDNWLMSVSLPNALQVSLGSKVSLEMELDRPYVQFKEHREKYPGKKGKHKKKGKKHKHGKKYDD